jgi:ankyrin repeat protein
VSGSDDIADDPLWDALDEVNTAIERCTESVPPLWDVLAPRLAEYPELVRTADNLGEYPLHKAAYYQCLPAIDWLLAAGAEVDVVTEHRRRMTPLHLAAEQGNVHACGRLAEAGADLARRAGNGYTPLRLAINGRHDAAVGALLRSGAPIDLRAAVCLRQPHLVRLLIRDDPEQVANGPDAAELIPDAAFFGGAEVLRLVLEAGADPTTPKASWEGLYGALFWNDRAAVELLLGHGADPDAEYKGCTARRWAEETAQEGRDWACELFARHRPSRDV